MSEENVTRESELRQPDAAFIRQHIPVEEIAEALGIEVTSKDFARCWRAAHPTGDREPSLHFHLNRTRCFLCDDHDFSNVDLVMKFTGLSFVQAVNWIAHRFPGIPDRGPGRPRGSKNKTTVYHGGVYGGELEPLVKSGLWASLSSSAHSLLVALMANRNEHAASTLSYDELRAASGLASTETISNATAELEAIHLLTVKQGIREIDLKRTKNIYRLNFDSEKYFAKISEAHRQLYPKFVAGR